MEAKRQCHWAIFQKIEYAGEQDQHKLHEFFTTCLEVFPHAKSG
jgi:serine/threonine-protein phosphatase with EF-hand domain